MARLARAAGGACEPARGGADEQLVPPSWPLRSATSHRGVARRRAATPSSRNGNRASRPRSLTSRSSLPMVRRHRRVASRRTASPSASQSRAGDRPSAGPSSFANARMASPDDAPARNAARWREYPAHCSSAPCPSRSTRARDAHGIRTPSARRRRRRGRAELFGEQPGGCRRRRRRDIDPAFPLASHSAAPMLRSITVRAGAAGREPAGKTPPNPSTSRGRTSRQARVGRRAGGAVQRGGAVRRSPPSKHTLMRSTALGGTYLCASAASSMLSTPKIRRR